MSAVAPAVRSVASRRQAGVASEHPLMRWVLTGVALAFVGLFLLVPLVIVFSEAFAKGPAAYFKAIFADEAFAAIRLTLLTAVIVVPLNFSFGIAAAWLIAKYDFWGKSVLLTLIDLPFSVSPVISGLIFVLLFGAQGWLGPFLGEHDVKVIFAVPGIVIATTFVTFPLVAREVLAVMQAQGSDQEEAAFMLGASGWQILYHVTLPKIRWGVLYGVILCNARAMGEFGAVSVVSGHIRGETNTMPLEVEILYNEYSFVGAFAVASLLTLLAVVTLVFKKIVEKISHQRDKRQRGARVATSATERAQAPQEASGT
ncbi:MAG TPA: sulfate ABC transporter permease subunit CysW [Polyangiaceae bacterium]|nr:sulfate ABC transporter permease subunit CysW [Polyangiaceae bacterium]